MFRRQRMNHPKGLYNIVERYVPFSHWTNCGHRRAGGHIYFERNSISIKKMRHLGRWTMHVLWYVNTPLHVKAIINTYGGCYFLVVAILQKLVSQEIGVCGTVGTTSDLQSPILKCSSDY